LEKRENKEEKKESVRSWIKVEEREDNDEW